MYMKKYFIYSAALLALVSSCQSDDFLGNTPGNVETSSANSAIKFDGGTGKITRATLSQTGATAAQTLGEKYVVYGYKTVGENKTAVFDHYTIAWDKTESNTKGWEYVGKKPNSLSGLNNDAVQAIKYWDYSATQYDFVAFSFGKATQGTGDGNVLATAVNTTSSPFYTLTGAVSDLANCFIADRITAKPNLATENKKPNLLVGYQNDVQFNFRSLSTKVTMGIYETIPGYSVKDVKFYSADNTKATNNAPTLYAKSKIIPAGKGTITVTFPTVDENNTDYNKAHVTFAVAEGSNNSSSIPFEPLSTVQKEKNEKGTTGFIGRDITTFSTPKKEDGTTKDYNVVIPANIKGGLTLKVDYTLESIDGSGEEIKVTGATAVVPEEYTNWQPNYAYTYIFKISDKTNGNTGGSTDPSGLYPIVFDAIVTETETGKQETITTVETRSITTYAKDAINNEYKTGNNIYVSVSGTDGKSEVLYKEIPATETSPVHYDYYAKLYKLTAGETITEAEVPSIIETTGMSLGGKTLTQETSTTGSFDTRFVKKIDAKDAVDGVEVKGNFFKFVPEAGTYVFAYVNGDIKSYKVIKVAAN